MILAIIVILVIVIYAMSWGAGKPGRGCNVWSDNKRFWHSLLMALISLPYFLLMAWYFLGQMEVWPGWKHTSLGESPAESGVGSHLCALAMLSIMLFPIPILFFAAGVASCISGFRVAARRPIVLCWVIPVVLSLLFPVLFLVLEPWLSSLL